MRGSRAGSALLFMGFGDAIDADEAAGPHRRIVLVVADDLSCGHVGVYGETEQEELDLGELVSGTSVDGPIYSSSSMLEPCVVDIRSRCRKGLNFFRVKLD